MEDLGEALYREILACVLRAGHDARSKVGDFALDVAEIVRDRVRRAAPEAPLTQGERAEVIAVLERIEHIAAYPPEGVLSMIWREACQLRNGLSASPATVVADRATGAPGGPSAEYSSSDALHWPRRPCPKCYAQASGFVYTNGALGLKCMECGFLGPRMKSPPSLALDKWAFDAWNDLPRHEDTEMLDWLTEQITDVIYLDNGRLIDVKGNCPRSAIRAAMRKP